MTELDLLKGPLVGSEGVGGDCLGTIEEVVLVDILQDFWRDQVRVGGPERKTAVNSSSIQLRAGGTIDDEVAFWEVTLDVSA